MDKYSFYALNVLLVALPLAIFEIIFEGSQGWGSGLAKDKWYAKPFAPDSRTVKLLVKILNIQSPLNYHISVFAVLIPLLMLAEYFIFGRSPVLIVAIYFGILMFEDFLWFLFNWHFDSLRQLLKGPNGSIWWHKAWIKVSPNHYLPASYPIAIAISGGLLLLA